MGWIGSVGEVKDYLRSMNADRDPKGNFLLTGPEGSGPVNFMGATGDEAETVIRDEVCFSVDGNNLGLAAGLELTGRGLSGIRVI